MERATKRWICWLFAVLVQALYLMLMGLEWSNAIPQAPFGLAGIAIISVPILSYAGYKAGQEPPPKLVYVHPNTESLAGEYRQLREAIEVRWPVAVGRAASGGSLFQVPVPLAAQDTAVYGTKPDPGPSELKRAIADAYVDKLSSPNGLHVVPPLGKDRD